VKLSRSVVVDTVVSVLLVAASVVVLRHGLFDPHTHTAAETPAAEYRAEEIASRGWTVQLPPGTYSPDDTVVVEFADFECPYCRVFANEVLPIVRARVRVAFRHFPVSGHSRAMPAAMAAVCAEAQGKFWQIHNLFFSDPRQLHRPLAEFPLALGMDQQTFSECLRSSAAAVQRDQREGERLGVNSTPQFFFGRVGANGLVALKRRVIGARPIRVFEDAISGIE